MEIKSVTEFILENLRYQIMTFKLKGGKRLNESEVSSQLKISRPPLREAFRILEQEHFIKSVPRKGRYVNELSTDNYERIHEARVMIECYVIEVLKAKKIKELPEVEIALKNVHEPPLPTASPDEKLRFIESIDEFHIKLVGSVKNEFLTHFYGIIRFNITRYSFLYLLEKGAAKYFVQQHHKILDMIKKGQHDKARDFLRSHMNESWERMRKKLTSDNSIQSDIQAIPRQERINVH
ncbi:MAG: GntR family transcriptional regulator [Thermodesulfobacteriota bacterium]|jgi:DNA-binding GntR family transcriptional regulator